MPEEWATYPLPEVLDFQEGPGILAEDFRSDGVPLIRLSGLESGASLLAGCNFLDPQMVQRRWAHFRLQEGDTLLSTSASLGRIAVVPPEARGAIPYTGIVRIRPRDNRVLPEFVRFLLKGPEFQRQVEMMGVGSVIRHFGPLHLRQMMLSVPPPSEQRAIVRILGSLDDKIDLNRRMNETLEAMARAIFKSWFVDFDPVRAKAEGQQPVGMDAEMAALFPDRFEEREGERVPAGWTVMGLDEIATFTNGLPLQDYPPEGGSSLPVIKIAQMRRGDTEGAERANANLESCYVVDDGDVLFSWSGSLEVTIWCGGRGALNQHIFKVTSKTYPKWFYYLWTKHHLDEFRAIAAGKATTMGHIQRHHLSEAKVLVPPAKLMRAIDAVMAPLIRCRVNNSLEARTLGAIRDALLPRLLSGELRVYAGAGAQNAGS